jgi:hypothetical protein
LPVAALADLAGTRQHASFNAAEVKVRMLREEYEGIKANLLKSAEVISLSPIERPCQARAS